MRIIIHVTFFELHKKTSGHLIVLGQGVELVK